MKKIYQTQAALSIIEILIAVGLMSMILTALAVNMAYTQRSISNAQMRSKSTDYVGSCMRKFRNLRDSNSWSNFCRVINITPTSTLNNTVCGPNTFTEGTHYVGVRNIRVDSACIGDPEKAKITIIFTYRDLSGIDRTVEQSQEFQIAPHEAKFR